MGLLESDTPFEKGNLLHVNITILSAKTDWEASVTLNDLEFFENYKL